jgi:hypothetical protein
MTQGQSRKDARRQLWIVLVWNLRRPVHRQANPIPETLSDAFCDGGGRVRRHKQEDPATCKDG